MGAFALPFDDLRSTVYIGLRIGRIMTAATEKTWFEKNEADDWRDNEAIFDEEEMHGNEKVYVASYWQLMWWRFRKHRMAMAGGGGDHRRGNARGHCGPCGPPTPRADQT